MFLLTLSSPSFFDVSQSKGRVGIPPNVYLLYNKNLYQLTTTHDFLLIREILGKKPFRKEDKITIQEYFGLQTSLPYRQVLINFIRQEKQSGRPSPYRPK